MLSNINISNLENSKTDSSVYSDACENSIQLEEEYNKKHELQSNKSNNNIKENNNIDVNQSVKIKLDKFLEKDDLNNQNESKNEINESNIMNNSLFKNNNINMNNNDVKRKEISNKNINNRYIINKNINCKNINKINLSNINIIINNDKENKENINSKKYFNNIPKLDINNISNNSIESIKEINKEKNNKFKNLNDIKNDNKNEENLKNDSIINNNINNESLSKNINNSKLAENYNNKKNSLHFSSTSNLDFNIFNNDFNNITIISKRKKKGDSNDISKSTVVNHNKSLSFSSNDISVLSNKIKFEDINYNQIDLNYLRHLRIIPIKYKKKGKRYLKTLLELQHFYVDSSDIRVIKISENGKFLAVGLENGKIKIFEILGYDYTKYELVYNKKNIMKYLNFINEKAYKSLEGHKEDVIDLNWSPFYYNLLLSSSVDGYVILWDVNLPQEKSKIESFNHEKIVTCVSFSPTEKNIFVTGCLDKIIRIWDITDLLNEESKNNNNSNNDDNYEKYNKEYFNIEEKITSLNFYPTGKELLIGTHNGKIIQYESKGEKYCYKGSFSCRNRLGKNSFGKKITSIEFLNKNYAVISSCDSRIRLVSIIDGKIICKYKGYLNENSMIKSCIDYNSDIIISGSEDGFVYVWDLYCIDDDRKNPNYEYFKPYSKEKIQCSLIVPEKIYCNYVKKIIKITNKLMISSIIINATNKGRLEILLNIDDEI